MLFSSKRSINVFKWPFTFRNTWNRSAFWLGAPEDTKNEVKIKAILSLRWIGDFQKILMFCCRDICRAWRVLASRCEASSALKLVLNVWMRCWNAAHYSTWHSNILAIYQAFLLVRGHICRYHICSRTVYPSKEIDVIPPESSLIQPWEPRKSSWILRLFYSCFAKRLSLAVEQTVRAHVQPPTTEFPCQVGKAQRDFL